MWNRGAASPSHRHGFGSTIGGIALDGKGKRLGVAHYNGATLLYGANPDSGRLALDWVGSHLACTMSAGGRYLVTALWETELHGWPLPARRDMRMSGYAAKTRSFALDRRGRWLATSGDDRARLCGRHGGDRHARQPDRQPAAALGDVAAGGGPSLPPRGGLADRGAVLWHGPAGDARPVGAAPEIGDAAFTMIGVATAGLVAALLLRARWLTAAARA